MYEDEDGTATKESQADYDARMRFLLSANSLLSWITFIAAIWNGEYGPQEDLKSTAISLNQPDLLRWSKFVWASLYIICDLMES